MVKHGTEIMREECNVSGAVRLIATGEGRYKGNYFTLDQSSHAGKEDPERCYSSLEEIKKIKNFEQK